jgi:biopolymer transport protein ExbD
MLFFLLGSSFVMQPGVEVDLPRGLMGLGSPIDRRVLTITAAGEIYFENQKTDLAGLGPQLEAFARKGVDRAIIIKADIRVPHGMVMGVLEKVLAGGLNAVIATRAGEG